MRWFLGGVLGGLVMFLWGAVSHMALPLGEMGLRTVQENREGALIEVMKGALTERAIYMFPGFDFRADPTPDQQQAWTRKVESGPTGLVIFNPGAGTTLGSGPLLTELATNILACLIAAWVVLQLAATVSFMQRALVVTALGAFAAVSIEASYWNWYLFPTAYFAAQTIDQVVGAFLAGLVLAAICRP